MVKFINGCQTFQVIAQFLRQRSKQSPQVIATFTSIRVFLDSKIMHPSVSPLIQNYYCKARDLLRGSTPAPKPAPKKTQ